MTDEDLDSVVAEMPPDRVTFGWLTEHIKGSSAEIVLVMVGLIGTLPGASGPMALFVAPPAVSMMLASSELRIPERLSRVSLPAPALRRLLDRTGHVIAWWHKHVHWRHAEAFPGMRRFAGVLALILAPLLIIPVPFSNVLPGFSIAALAFACLENDAVLFFLAILATAISFVLCATAVLTLGTVVVHAL